MTKMTAMRAEMPMTPSRILGMTVLSSPPALPPQPAAALTSDEMPDWLQIGLEAANVGADIIAQRPKMLTISKAESLSNLFMDLL